VHSIAKHYQKPIVELKVKTKTDNSFVSFVSDFAIVQVSELGELGEKLIKLAGR
jgi:hypothetical protein